MNRLKQPLQISVFLLYIFAINQYAIAQATQHKNLKTYLSYLVGNFDNLVQVEDELKAGKQIHPFAKHVSRTIQSRIKNIPEGYNGVFVLEESYYKYPDKDTLIKPYIFRFEVGSEGEVILHSVAIPTGIDKTKFRNDNPDWVLDFNDLKDSPTFKPAAYTKTKRGFYIKNPIELGNGMRFTLEETIGKGFLEVMELTEKDGKRLTPYETPLQYKKR